MNNKTIFPSDCSVIGVFFIKFQSLHKNSIIIQIQLFDVTAYHIGYELSYFKKQIQYYNSHSFANKNVIYIVIITVYK
jgi:hypothetical protein